MFVSALVRVRFEAGRRGAVQGASLKAAHGSSGPIFAASGSNAGAGCFAI